MLGRDSASQKTTTSGGSSLTCKIPRYRSPVQLKRICQSLQLSAKVPYESNTQMSSLVIIFSRKRLESADFRSKIPFFYQKISRFRKCNLSRRYPKWRQTRLTKKEKEEIILCVLCDPLEFQCDAVVKNQKKDLKHVILLSLETNRCFVRLLHKGQLNSEWIYEVIVSPKMPTKNYQDFCPTL